MENTTTDAITNALSGVVFTEALKIRTTPSGHVFVSTFLGGVCLVAAIGDTATEALEDFRKAYEATMAGARCARFILPDSRLVEWTHEGHDCAAVGC